MGRLMWAGGRGMMLREVMGMTSSTEPVPGPSTAGRVSLDDLARRKGLRPVTSLEDMKEDGVFGSDDEVEEFLQYVQAARQADLG